jgi:outer membrane protein OmpA-like peptidoglycan-associated protein
MQMLFEKLQRIKMTGPGEKGRSRVEAQGAEGTDPDVTSIRPGRQSAVGGRVVFDKGQFQLSRESVNVLDQIVGQIKGHRNIVLIRGHTSLDDLGEAATAEQKMDLSLRRAQAVSDYLTLKGVSPDILRVLGCSTFEPVHERAYTANRQAFNRRVEVEATTTLVQQLQDQPRTPPTTVTTPTAATDTPSPSAH